jgi:2-polyprenyl-3-methyl-5-hydroxy-6-metoxy-1,4-benzoquinol methylase
LYHTVRNYTVKQKRSLIEKLSGKKKGALLDVGAGTGAFVAVMRNAGWNVTGLEPDETARENALKNHQLQLQTLNALFSFDDKHFDVITLWHVLEHVHELHKYVETFYRILKDNGTLIIAVPNYTSNDASAYKEFWAAYDLPRHLYHFSPASMQRLMQQHNFKIVEYKPMWFDSFYVAMLSEKYKTGHNNLVSAAWSGISSNMEAMSNAKKCSSIIYVIKKDK